MSDVSTITSLGHVRYWAKSTPTGAPGIDVKTHCLNVGWVAFYIARHYETLLRQFSVSPNQVAFLATTHDCGKISYDFETQLSSWVSSMGWVVRRGSSRKKHGEYTTETLQRYFHSNPMASQTSCAYWATIVGSHHGTLGVMPIPGQVTPVESKHQRSPEPDWERDRQQLISYARTVFPCSELPEIQSNSPAMWIVGGLIVLADWIASNELFFPCEKKVDASKVAQESLADLQIEPFSVCPGLAFETVFGFPQNEFQKQIEKWVTEPGLYAFEAPMGLGKTEAALWAAYKLIGKGMATGIYFALPTQTTSNRMWFRIQHFVDRVSPKSSRPRLIHGKSWLYENDFQIESRDGKLSEASKWFSSSRRALFAQIGVGTVDQALLAILGVRHFFLRRAALAGKVVILDEVHSYDAYTGELVKVLSDELVRLGATVIILSATLTNTARARLFLDECQSEDSWINTDTFPVLFTKRISGSSIQFLKDGTELQNKKVEIHWDTKDSLANRALHWVNEGARILWICDTVSSAQEVFRLFREKASDGGKFVGLLHSRFPYCCRQQLEKKWLHFFDKDSCINHGCVLVSTQIVEQSVDIDADILVTEIAPTDMIFQRIGRLQRHNRGPRKWMPQCWIVKESNSSQELASMSVGAIKKCLGKKGYVYDYSVLLRTMRLWEQKTEVLVPADIRPMLQETYEGEIPDNWKELDLEREGIARAKRTLALQAANVWTASLQDDEEVCQGTRLLSQRTIHVVLYTRMDKKGIELINGDYFDCTEKDELKIRKAFAFSATEAPVRSEDVFSMSKTEQFWISKSKVQIETVLLNANDSMRKPFHYDKNLGLIR